MTTQEFIKMMNHAGLRVEIGREAWKYASTRVDERG